MREQVKWIREKEKKWQNKWEGSERRGKRMDGEGREGRMRGRHLIQARWIAILRGSLAKAGKQNGRRITHGGRFKSAKAIQTDTKTTVRNLPVLQKIIVLNFAVLYTNYRIQFLYSAQKFGILLSCTKLSNMILLYNANMFYVVLSYINLLNMRLLSCEKDHRVILLP